MSAWIKLVICLIAFISSMLISYAIVKNPKNHAGAKLLNGRIGVTICVLGYVIFQLGAYLNGGAPHSSDRKSSALRWIAAVENELRV